MGMKEQATRFHAEEKQKQKSSFVSYGGSTRGGSKVFQEDHVQWEKGILDPGSEVTLKWNRIFLFSCFIALFIDPLYYYLPTVSGPNHSCVKLDRTLSIVVSFFRTIVDIFYFLHIAIKFRTAYIAPSSRVFGRGELVMNRSKIAKRYLSSEFFIELIAALPLPQIVIWIVMPVANNSNSDKNYHALSLVVFLQYIPRLYLIFPLSNKIIKATGVVTKTAWAGAAYNLLLYMLASHVLGASWYLLSIERLTTCWLNECKKDINCLPEYLNCEFLNGINRQNWENSTSVLHNCDVNFGNDGTISFNYGIFEGALSNNVVSINFIQKYFYCLWWGLQNLSSYGQNLATSTYIGETTFAIIIAIIGLVLFAHLIGNMQTYLQSVTIRLEEWRLKRRDTEEWMSHRQLPRELRERVRKFIQYKWLATRGVNEELILQSLPMDLRRDIQRHLCLDLVRRVPFFSKMDDQLLDAICERLVSSLSTEGTYIVREGDPVTEMYFIIRGKLESSTTNGGRTGFFNSINLRPGDFCGEELLAWALLPKSAVNLPSSTRTVLALVEVEAFALRAEDLKFVSNQFRRLHSKKLQHTFRFYSHHWRSWAACFVQAAWNRYKRRKLARDLINVQKGYPFKLEERAQMEDPSSSFISDSSHPKHVTHYATKFSSYRRSPRSVATDDNIPKLQKPHEPDFSEDAYND